MIWLILALTLGWTDNSGGPATCFPGSQICDQEDGFDIRRRLASDTYAGPSYRNFIVARDATVFIDNYTVIGETYCYQVSAYNTRGQSVWSNEACATDTGAPGSKVPPNSLQSFQVALDSGTIITLPQDLTATKTSPNTVRLTWSKITDPAAAWVIVQVSKDGGPFALINDSKTSTQGTSYDHIGVTAGTYKYRLRVWDSTLTKPLGFSNESNAVVV